MPQHVPMVAADFNIRSFCLDNFRWYGDMVYHALKMRIEMLKPGRDFLVEAVCPVKAVCLVETL
jgi:hypothetical protein